MKFNGQNNSMQFAQGAEYFADMALMNAIQGEKFDIRNMQGAKGRDYQKHFKNLSKETVLKSLKAINEMYVNKAAYLEDRGAQMRQPG